MPDNSTVDRPRMDGLGIGHGVPLLSLRVNFSVNMDRARAAHAQAYAYVLNRVTGQQVRPFEQPPAPASNVPGEQAWPTQRHWCDRYVRISVVPLRSVFLSSLPSALFC
jgi:hypothetical protein